MNDQTDQLQKRIRELAGQRLEQLMSDISEDYYCAGWNCGLENDLWSMVRGGDRDYGMGTVPIDTVAELRRLAAECGGWHDGEVVVPMDEWKARFARWWRDVRIPVLRRHVEFVRSEMGKRDCLDRLTTPANLARAKATLADAEKELPAIQAEAEGRAKGAHV